VRSLVLELRNEPEARVDLSGLGADLLARPDTAAMQRLKLGAHRHAPQLGDLFKIRKGDASSLVFEGGSERLDGIGTGMTGGAIRVAGDAGARLGRLMSGGTITVEGSVSAYAGSGMRGGRIEVLRDAGDHVGAPLAGELAGMRGGVILVRGNAGMRTGDRMRRGLIAIGGDAGDHAGARMIAGTLVVAGAAGAAPGSLMRRGTIVLGAPPRALAPSFVPCAVPDGVFVALLDRWLIEEGVSKSRMLGGSVTRYGGDNAVLGLGEILVRDG
jgi:formylmethanofuran dehydrogenase subunit C